MSLSSWHILTGEYPPQTGGVSDYTAQVAAGLAEHGAQVQVWTGEGQEGAADEARNVHITRLNGLWSRTGLKQLSQELARWPAPRRLLVQYAPNAWGYKGLNFAFCRWLWERRKLGDDVRLMVHEPFYPWRLRDKPTRWLLAAGQRRMMRTLLAASHKVYVAIPGWTDLIRPFDREPEREIVWLPICSTIPVCAQTSQVETLRQWLAPNNEFILGSFGGFGGGVGELTEAAVAAALARQQNTVALFIGAGGERLVERLARKYPKLASRLHASGLLPALDVSCHLLACDVLLQAYPDGVSTRRTSTIAGLAHGRPIVTMRGTLTEPFWTETNCVRLVTLGDAEGCATTVKALWEDAPARYALGEHARAVYEQHLSVQRTVAKLMAT